METIVSGYGQMPMSPEGKSISSTMDAGKKTNNDLEEGIPTSEIINKITVQNREVKNSMARMIEQNKALQKDV